MYGSIKSLYCIPEINITPYVNYTGIKKCKKINKTSLPPKKTPPPETETFASKFSYKNKTKRK